MGQSKNGTNATSVRHFPWAAAFPFTPSGGVLDLYGVLDWYGHHGYANGRQPVGNPGNPLVTAHRRQPECNGFVRSCDRDLGGMANAFQIGYRDARQDLTAIRSGSFSRSLFLPHSTAIRLPEAARGRLQVGSSQTAGAGRPK